MERYYNSHSFEKDIFIKSGNSRIKVNLYDIEFVESSHVPHRLTMHLDNRRIDFYGSLKDVEKINDHLFRCHQSYVVNLLNIREVMPGEKKVMFKNGETCSVSSRYLKKLLHKMECSVKAGR